MIVYVLFGVAFDHDGEVCKDLINIYSTKKLADKSQRTIERLSPKLYDNFFINKYEVKENPNE